MKLTITTPILIIAIIVNIAIVWNWQQIMTELVIANILSTQIYVSLCLACVIGLLPASIYAWFISVRE